MWLENEEVINLMETLKYQEQYELLKSKAFL